MTNNLKAYKYIDITNLNIYKHIHQYENISDVITTNYDTRYMTNLIEMLYSEYDDSLLDFNILVNFITNLDISILRNSTLLLYTLDYARVIEKTNTNLIKVEYNYRR